MSGEASHISPFEMNRRTFGCSVSVGISLEQKEGAFSSPRATFPHGATFQGPHANVAMQGQRQEVDREQMEL